MTTRSDDAPQDNDDRRGDDAPASEDDQAREEAGNQAFRLAELMAHTLDTNEDGRKWLKVLGEFVNQHLPVIGEGGGYSGDSVPDHVQVARDDALIAAFERIERICRADMTKRSMLPGKGQED